MDIHSLIQIVICVNFLQVFVLLVQRQFNKTIPGLGWWTMGTAGCGFGFLFLFFAERADI